MQCVNLASCSCHKPLSPQSLQLTACIVRRPCVLPIFAETLWLSLSQLQPSSEPQAADTMHNCLSCQCWWLPLVTNSFCSVADWPGNGCGWRVQPIYVECHAQLRHRQQSALHVALCDRRPPVTDPCTTPDRSYPHPAEFERCRNSGFS